MSKQSKSNYFIEDRDYVICSFSMYTKNKCKEKE